MLGTCKATEHTLANSGMIGDLLEGLYSRRLQPAPQVQDATQSFNYSTAAQRHGGASLTVQGC